MRSCYALGRQLRLSNREFKSLRNYLGRVVRDIERKVAGDEELKCVFSESLSLAQRMLSQMHQDKNKIYSINAPEVECISKGKAHKKYEFGCKVSVAATSKECFVVGMKAHHGNPYDAHTLEEVVSQIERISGFKANEFMLTGDIGGITTKARWWYMLLEEGQ